MAKGEVSDSSIRVKIEAFGGKRVNAVVLAETIQSLQNTMFSVCEYLEGKTPKSGGDFSKKVRESCEFEVKDLKIGSAELVLSLPSQTATLGGDGRTLGARSLDLTKELIKSINDEDYCQKVEKLVPKQINRKRILENLSDVAPLSEKYSVTFSSKKRHGRFDYKSRQRIISIIPKIDIPDSRKLTGWLIDLRVDSKKGFKIDTSEGILSGEYTPAVEKFFKNNLGGLVILEGKTSKNKKDFIEITPESNITRIDKYPLTNFKVNEKMFTIKDHPLQVSIDFDERKYVLSEEEFGLLVTSDNMKDGIAGIKTQLSMLWAAYVDCPESKLNEGAKQLREKLKELVK